MLKTRKKVFILLVVFVSVSGLPAQASVVPGCAGMAVPAPSHCAASCASTPVKHSCCGGGADCDCSVETRSSDLLQNAAVTGPSRVEANGLQFRVSESKLLHESFNALPDTEELPPQETPLYDLYSDYRI